MLGNKSTLVRRQVLCNMKLQGYVYEGVFLVVPKLIYNCILEISFLYENNCIVDFRKYNLEVSASTDDSRLVLMCAIVGEENQRHRRGKVKPINCRKIFRCQWSKWRSKGRAEENIEGE